MLQHYQVLFKFYYVPLFKKLIGLFICKIIQGLLKIFCELLNKTAYDVKNYCNY